MRLSPWSRHLAWAACAAIGITLSAAGSAQATLIDSFATAFNPPQTFITAGTFGQTATVVNDATGIIGGQREMMLTVGSTDGLAVVIPSSSGIMQVQAGSGVQSTLSLTYDGSSPIDTFDATGLGGIALTGGNFLLRAMTTSPITATFRVFTDANNFSEGILTTATSGAFQTFALAFSEFAVGAGAAGGADFNNVGAIQIDLTVTGDALVGYDGFESGEAPSGGGDPGGGLAVVPEPGSWALLSLGAIGVIGFSWFHRRKTQLA